MSLITQKNFNKGVDASTSKLSTPEGAVRRISNMLFTRRGSLKSADGLKATTIINGLILDTAVVAIADATSGPGLVPVMLLEVQQPGGGNPYTSYSLYDITSLSPVLLTFSGVTSGANDRRQPQLINYGGYTIFAMGNDIAWLAWNNQGSVGYQYFRPDHLSGPAYPGAIPVVSGQNPPLYAAHAVNHLGSLWLFNTGQTTGQLDGPSSLRMSDPGVINSWPSTNQVFLDKDDGTQGQGLISFTLAESGIAPTATLVAFKDFSTYQIEGVLTPSGNPSVKRAQTEMGCVAPRSIQFAPGFGIVRLTHLGVSLFDGVKDVLLSEEVRPYLYQTEQDISPMDWSRVGFCYAAISSNPPMYVLAIPVLGNPPGLTRLLCYDLILKAWTVIDLPFPIFSLHLQKLPGILPVFLAGDYTLQGDPISSPGTAIHTYRWLSGDSSFNGTPINWSFRTPEASQSPPGQQSYYRRSILRARTPPGAVSETARFAGRQRTSVINANFQFLIAQSLYGSARYGSGIYGLSDDDLVVPFDLHQTAFSASGEFSGSIPIEILSVDWQLEQKQPGFFARIS